MSARQSAVRLFEDDRLYSAKEIAKKIGGGTHVVTVWRWSKKGRLGSARKIGPNTTRFLGRELNENLFPVE
jgi:predicted DNA-binding transcriptional regulator AlpA